MLDQVSKKSFWILRLCLSLWVRYPRLTYNQIFSIRCNPLKEDTWLMYTV